jgi:hypothetical protein
MAQIKPEFNFMTHHSSFRGGHRPNPESALQGAGVDPKSRFRVPSPMKPVMAPE